ncbi:Ubiquitin carboxyl-terminal hydrolase 36 [Frankliniella fusca]|uniref:Ubiquitin carboxyl-terminal hydrolase 36 n=1 Tax=Frankliniella fusca TaxID=407009 RepID=A0AAE1HAX4_9NEOP|nr:Ubiquitin carboxyl-terminal hydrolase 36 [Frankliniella fusca]
MGSPKDEWKNNVPPESPDVILYPPVVSNAWDVKLHRDTGISNFGNTCFINACLQMIFHVPSVLQWFETTDHPSSCKKPLRCMTCSLLKTWRQYKCSKDPNIRPAAFVSFIRSAFTTPSNDYDRTNNKQEDAHELLLFLLQKLEDDFITSSVGHECNFFTSLTNPIFQNFGGWLTTKCVCSSCFFVSKTYSPFTSLTLDIENCQSVKGALEKFLDGEKIEDYKCYGCENNQTVQKAFDFYKTPSTLILQLKRFQQDRSKNNNSVSVNQRVVLKVGAEESRYNLLGAVLHLSDSKEQGHYISIVQCPDNSWVQFDDQKIKKMTKYPQDILSSSAYILLYSKESFYAQQTILPSHSEVINASPGKKSHFYVTPMSIDEEKKTCAIRGPRAPVQFLVSPLKNKEAVPKYGSICDDMGCLPLPLDGTDTSLSKDTVSPLKILKRRKPLPNTYSSQTSNDYLVVSQSNGVKRAGSPNTGMTVSPKKIKWQRKIAPKSSSSQSSNDYFIQSQTMGVIGDDCSPAKKKQVTPFKIHRQRKPFPKSSSSQSSNDYFIQSQTIGLMGGDCSPGNKITEISPIIIHRQRKPFPKSSSSQSSNDYHILPPNNRLGGSPGKRILTPLKITWQKRTIPKTSSSQSSNDYQIQSQINGISRPRQGTVSPLKIKWKQKKRESPENSFEVGSPDSPPTEGFQAASMMDRNIEEAVSPTVSVVQNNRESSENSFEVDSPDTPPTKGFQAVQLMDTDVEGAVLPMLPIVRNNVPTLKRWLQCRGLPATGNKEDLVERVALHMSKGNYHILKPGVDKGIWYDQKVAALQIQNECNNDLSQAISQDELQPPLDKWSPFPSISIPPHFNFGHIYFYLIETCPTLPNDDDSEVSEADEQEVLDPLDDEYQTINGVKVLRKGLNFLKSKYVRAVENCSHGRCYFVKASVRASMEKRAYEVTIAISHRSGSIHACTCECIQQSLGRCVHVSSVLLYLWSHVRLNGNGGKSIVRRVKLQILLSFRWNTNSQGKDQGINNNNHFNLFHFFTFFFQPTHFNAILKVGGIELSNLCKGSM